MEDLELATSSSQQKRPSPSHDDQALSESVQETSVSCEDGTASLPKKLRVDDSVVAIDNEVIQVASEAAIGDDEGKKTTDPTNEEGDDDSPNGERAKVEAGGKLSSGQDEDMHLEGGGADDGCDLGENDQDVEQEDVIKEQAKEIKLGANNGRGLDEDGESVKREDGVEARSKEVKLGPKVFTSSLDMFNYFYDLLRGWPINFNVNKYEHMMLEDLIKKGHQDAARKIGAGIEAFQIQINPEFYSRCYYIIQKDGSSEDFSYRKCVDTLMPLPDNMKSPSGDLKIDRKGRGQQNNRGRGGRFVSGGGNRGRGNRGHRGHKRF